eukprot:Seg1585.3 transcript_id=Seg1585.3/GoldUCD/mRNA.D3Y31 product="hypothetical protein" protein_id=Seg1585.3/GoldUCD/D3Y31
MQLTIPELAEVVKQFYMTTRKKDGTPYKLCSYLTIRRCLSLIFQYDYGLQKIDITCDPEFLDANVVFSQMSHSLRGREENFGLTESWRLTPEKLKKLYSEGQLDFYNTQNPKILLQTVYFYICYYTGIGKLSVMRKICMIDVEEVAKNGQVIAYNFNLRKYLPTEKGSGPFTINEIPGKPWCPVLTIREYLSHRNKGVQTFFQKPLTRSQCFGSSIWFKRSRFKDVYPLASMCREANIDPALTSGCFNKARISAEIRYEMSFIYAKLFPQCFNSTDDIQQIVKMNGTKKKRGRRPMYLNHLENKQAASASNGLPNNQGSATSIENGTTSSNARSSFMFTDDDLSPPSMAVSMGSTHNPSFRPSTSRQSSGIESSPHARHDMSSITVSNVFSYRKEDVVAVEQKQAGSRAETTGKRSLNEPMRRRISPAASSTTTNAPRQPASTVVASRVDNRTVNTSADNRRNMAPSMTEQKPCAVISLDNDSDDSESTFEHSVPHSGTRDVTPNTSSHFQQAPHSAMQTHSPNTPVLQNSMQNTPSFLQTSNSVYSSQSNTLPANYRANETSVTPSQTRVNPHMQTQGLPMHQTATVEQPQAKKSRFDTSSHTFLREISASAREQGKGAVMLLLSLLDDISNNHGKELLKDILQEMKVI